MLDCDGIAKDQSGSAREIDVPAFRRARSAQVTGDLMSVSEGVSTVEELPELVGDVIKDDVSPYLVKHG